MSSLPILRTESLTSVSVDILKKQAQQNQAEYDRLATEYNAKTGAVSDKRKD